MYKNWTRFEGQSVREWRLESFLGERDDKAFFRAINETEAGPVLVELMMSGGADAEAALASWSIARTLEHEHLQRIRMAGMEELEDGVTVNSAVLEMPDDDLSEMIPCRALEEHEVRSMLLAAAHALDYLHGRGVAHGAVLPANIFLIGERYKLSVDTLVCGDRARQQADIRQLGATLVWVLTGGAGPVNQPSAESIAGLDPGFRDLATGCLNGWTAAKLISTLEGRYVSSTDEQRPVQTAPGASAKRWILPGIVLAAVLFLAVYLLLGRPRHGKSPLPVTTARLSAPGPPSTPVTQPAPENAGAGRAIAPVRPGSWAVVAAAYGTRAGAEHRAELIRRRWKRFQARVFPSTGVADHYLVVLGSDLSHDAAERLMRGARATGVAADSYATKLADR